MTVRISTNQILDTGVQAMDNSLSAAISDQQKIDTGFNYNQASDNSYAVSTGVRLQFDTNRLNMYTSNQNFVSSSMSNTDTQMTSIINNMNSIQQLMVQSQNGSLNTSDYQALEQSAQGYLDNIKQLASAQDGTGNPIFPSTVNQVEVEPNVTVNTALKYSDVFGGSGSGKTDVIQKVQDFVNYLGNLASGGTINPGQTFSVSSSLKIGTSTVGTGAGTGTSSISDITTNDSANVDAGSYTIKDQTANGVTSVFLQDGSGNQTTPVAVPDGATSIDFGNGVVINLTSTNGGDTGANIATALAGQTIAVTSNESPGTAQSVSDGLKNAFSQLSIMQEAGGSIANVAANAKTDTTAIGTNLASTTSALLDTDVAAATAQYTKDQTTLTAAETMFAKLSQSNLFSQL